MVKKYYIGFDIGTDSIGWAVTDENYNLIKVRGRDYWGSFLFDEANTAEATRLKRTARRRSARARNRIKLLQELFAQEVFKVDPAFFIRLENSKYFIEDKEETVRDKYLLFNDIGFTDKEFYKKYPTIFHLRKALIEEEITDIRLLYLGIHHILKNRGHFLFENQEFSIDDDAGYKDNFYKINEFLTDSEAPIIPIESFDKIFNILSNDKYGKQSKSKMISALLSKNKQISEVINAICGKTFNLENLLLSEEGLETSKMTFDSSNFDDEVSKIAMLLDEDKMDIIFSLKRIYDLSILQNILHGHQYLSFAKIDNYEEHKNDLYKLKKYIKENCPDKYKMVFSYQEKVNNYASYVGMDKNRRFRKCKLDDFYAFLRKEIDIKDESILQKIEDRKFLQKQISGENSVVPYQVHLSELEAILKNAESYFPFLTDKSDDLTTSQKIISLMTFRIPYYVGPLTDRKTKHSWMIKKEGYQKNKILPWNFEKVVDIDATAQEFILRMTNKCTYLVGEDVLPSYSLLYSEFKLLNELNNLTVNGIKDDKVKNILFKLAHSTKKLTKKKCFNELLKHGLIPHNSNENEIFGGIDDEIKGSLSSYIDLKSIIGTKVDTHYEMCEQIILWITLFSDKDRLAKIISKEYGNILTPEEVKQIKSLNYSKWGTLSRRLLTETFEIDKDGVVGESSIIDRLRNTMNNFMQIINYYGYKRAIDDYNDSQYDDNKVSYRTVDELYCSPAVKRPIWNTLKIAREIKKVIGGSPAKIFIETTRGKKDKTKKGTRTVSRKQSLMDLYNNLGEEGKTWVDEINKIQDREFKDKVYLYYTQMGRDMYKNEKIPFEQLFNNNIYDIDHIYPKSKIKDDSLQNRVLVNKIVNVHEKKDTYPIPIAIQKEMKPFWLMLKEKGLISESKYMRLTRTNPLTTDECADFINRQLVETSQSAKATASLLKKIFPSSEIVYSKAIIANEFKEHIGLVKVRELNDLHHAKDAYINIVVGNVYNTKFNHNAKEYFKANGLESYNLTKIYNHDINGAWKKGDENRIQSIAEKNTCRVERFTSTIKGELFDATIKPAGANNNLIPLKAKGPLTNTSKYGGYDSATSSYFMLVRSKDKNNKTKLTLECMTVYADRKYNTMEEKIKYCKEQCNLNNPEIVISRIKINTLFKLGDSYVYLKGRTGKRIIWCNANQLFLDQESIKYLKSIANYFRDVDKYKNDKVSVSEKINIKKNIELYNVFAKKFASPIYSTLTRTDNAKLKILEENRSVFESMDLENQCRVLFQILKLLQCKNSKVNLSEINGPREIQGTVKSNDITNQNVRMILSSPTGAFYKVFDFNKFL